MKKKKPDHFKNQKCVSNTETSGCVTDGRKKYLCEVCEWEGRYFSLLLVVELAVAAYWTGRHKPGKSSLSPDSSSSQQTTATFSYFSGY